MKARRPRKLCSVSVDSEVWAKLHKLSHDRDESIASYIRKAIDLFLQRELGTEKQ